MGVLDPPPLSELAELCGAVTFADPYRVLEDETGSVLDWQRARNAETCAAIAALGSLDGLTAALGRHLAACAVTTPKRGGDRWFWHERTEEGDGDALSLSAELMGSRQTVCSASALACGEQPSIDWYAPSPDGRWIAAGASSGGDEQSTLCLVDADSGAVVQPRLRHLAGGRVAWLPDSRGLYCCAGLTRETEGATKVLYHVEPGVAAQRVRMPPGCPDHHLMVHVSADGRYVGVAANPWCPRLCHVLDRSSGRWREVFPVDRGHVFHGVFADGRYVAVTTRGAPRGRVVSAPLESIADESSWVELLGQGAGVIRALAPAPEGLVVCDYLDGELRLRLLRSGGGEACLVEMPTAGAVGPSRLEWAQVGTDLPIEVTREEIVFTFSTPAASPAVYRFGWRSTRPERVTTPLLHTTAAWLETRACRSSDGREVRFDVLHPAATGRAGPSPALIAAYGGWNALWQAKGYPGMFAPFVEAGGTFVFAHLRGDGTFGADEWRGGRRERKQRTFDDLYAVAEQLIADGTTTPGQLALYGASNGGLLGGVAITQRPELFRAVAALVPLFDMCRFLRERFAELYTWEYGDPRLPEQAAWIRPYSPYHNIRPGIAYPATMIVCASRDIRTHPWHGRKMAAALRAANAGGHPIHLRVHEGRGHFTAAGQAPPRLIAEWLGFLMSEVGLPLPADRQDEPQPPAIGRRGQVRPTGPERAGR